MIQLSGKSIAFPPKILFKSMLEDGVFPGDGEKTNIVSKVFFQKAILCLSTKIIVEIF